MPECVCVGALTDNARMKRTCEKSRDERMRRKILRDLSAAGRVSGERRAKRDSLLIRTTASLRVSYSDRKDFTVFVLTDAAEQQPAVQQLFLSSN